MKAGVYVCKFCKSIQQTTEIYALRDFEKCNTHSRVPESFTHKKCQGIGYIIPKEYEPYEIKKVSEINTKEFTFNQSWNFWDEVEKHNLKEDGRVIIRRR